VRLLPRKEHLRAEAHERHGHENGQPEDECPMPCRSTSDPHAPSVLPLVPSVDPPDGV